MVCHWVRIWIFSYVLLLYGGAAATLNNRIWVCAYTPLLVIHQNSCFFYLFYSNALNKLNFHRTIAIRRSFLHDVTERNKLVRLNGDGTVTYGMRFTTTLACNMDLHYYPLDSQNCTVEIESCKSILDSSYISLSLFGCRRFVLLHCHRISDGYTMLDVEMSWRKPAPVLGVFDTELPQFTILGFETNDRQVK